MIKEMIFWGATGHAKVLKQCLRESGVELIALFDNDNNIKSPYENVPIYYGTNAFENWINSRKSVKSLGFLVAIGGDKGKDRVDLYEFLESFGLSPLRAIHSSAFVDSTSQIGSGSQILANSTISVDVKLGRCCIINTSASVDHDCILGEGVHICPGASLAGCITVGDYSTIGTGASVLPRINIGSGSVVGAGSVVIENVPDNTVVVGNPARTLRKA